MSDWWSEQEGVRSQPVVQASQFDVPKKDEFVKFMNDRKEVKRMPYRIVRPNYMRNAELEQLIADQERERVMTIMILIGSLMLLYGVM